MSDNVTERAPDTDSIPVSVHKAPARRLSSVLEGVDTVSAVWAPPDGPPIVSVGTEAAVTASGSERVEQIREAGQRLLRRVDSSGHERAARPRLFGGFSFFERPILEAPWAAFSPARFVLPAVQITLAPDKTVIAGFGESGEDRAAAVNEAVRAASSHRKPPTSTANKPRDRTLEQRQGDIESGLEPDRPTWVERVRSIQATIDTTSLEKAVLSAALHRPLEEPISLAKVMHQLEARYPDCYRFCFTGQQGAAEEEPPLFFGASPETLVSQRGRQIETEALAGTVERGETKAADDSMKTRLLDDETLSTEHELVAARIAGQLEAFGAEVTVGERIVRTLANVHHLETPIEATVPSRTHVLDLVALLHPTPAMGGLPTTIASETIRDVETTVRGWYSAPIGWFDESGDGSFAVGIRSALADRDHLTLFAGNGIVAGSDPETEYEELAAKFEPILEVLE